MLPLPILYILCVLMIAAGAWGASLLNRQSDYYKIKAGTVERIHKRMVNIGVYQSATETKSKGKIKVQRHEREGRNVASYTRNAPAATPAKNAATSNGKERGKGRPNR